jgi:hypothetical protein
MVQAVAGSPDLEAVLRVDRRVVPVEDVDTAAVEPVRRHAVSRW